ncbi:MAG: hypothetical protein KUA35_14830 [Pseudodesulfovibrio sp.]|uniref:YkgJ family cysteine cluster protein n=1 Tax=Pseudodesulfovibrio aespoeensis (strain ATCC 700646 / DSM 10631 / Aspo-2) TaxID=643562 RepID=E6VY23_PSEA9|nr:MULTISPECIES: hypothetical protein [Pseudodesulfovibrio]MBU4191218.1 hypothetical protein [Pseudomonadota bacterium]ADU63837.1 hypothetical protein Daes_2841 [Pseudodesulfovibrio aespoeensis Aspo-2]MBU4244291.1 hypothetical protein [Pseudomonadota bacterium]MBU4377609.1 hypothetical protein [Pseudomonadota bacterium]MBU4475569.1 hypothetical protein [Pseudomonadota bacterium]
MKKLTPKGAFRKLAAIYSAMVDRYGETAGSIGLTCDGCPDNCCLSFFQHHTHVEWAYLWEGLAALPPERLEEIRIRARDYVEQAQNALSRGLRPRIMCPLNLADQKQGICGLYDHRLMICRMHGVPNELVRPDGRRVVFPGCQRCQGLTEGLKAEGGKIPVVDRTPLYRELAALEMQFVGNALRSLPKVDHTIAEMIVLGPPRLR